MNALEQTSDTEGTETRRNQLLSRRISDLALAIEGTRLGELVDQLYQELEAAGISLRPKTYLTDEWGCPSKVPIIGIPFYLADPELQQLEGELTGEDAEDEDEVIMYLRHEAGHAFNYAYRLYHKPEWRQIFGKFSMPYQESYRPSPFSPRFVEHIPGWYAQKHPDEDFAETFAVWLTPGSRWRETYENTPAMTKLLYVEQVAQRFGRQPPMVATEELDMPLDQLTMTLGDWYKTYHEGDTCPTLPASINGDLHRLFPSAQGQPAADLVEAHRRLLIREVFRWTAMDRHTISLLLSELLQRVRSLDLRVEADEATSRMVSAAIFLTTLAMNYQRTGQFLEA